MRGFAIVTFVVLTVATVPGRVSAAPKCFGQIATITGTGEINGTTGDDVIVGSNGADVIDGGGNDALGDVCHHGVASIDTFRRCAQML